MSQFDYTKTYYKVMNKDENHNGFQYHDGLNVLRGPFNDRPWEMYVAGRLYFTDYNYLPTYFHRGIWIREVKIPNNARIIQMDAGCWGTNKLILGKKYHIYKDFKQWFKKDEFNYELNSNVLAKDFSKYFNIWWDKKRFNYAYHNSFTLAKYCSKYFNKWWDKQKFDYAFGSEALAECCSEYFPIWWDKENFNYMRGSGFLARYCTKYFKDWWDETKFNMIFIDVLKIYCKRYKKFWEHLS